MAKKSSLLQQFKDILPILSMVSTTIIFCISSWLTIKLVPITQSVSAAEIRISNLEKVMTDVKSDTAATRKSVEDIYKILVSL